jgi:hypothetical protein
VSDPFIDELHRICAEAAAIREEFMAGALSPEAYMAKAGRLRQDLDLIKRLLDGLDGLDEADDA